MEGREGRSPVVLQDMCTVLVYIGRRRTRKINLSFSMKTTLINEVHIVCTSLIDYMQMGGWRQHFIIFFNA